MKFFSLDKGRSWKALVLAYACCLSPVMAEEFAFMGITEVVAAADGYLKGGNYSSAIPALEEVIKRTETLTDPQGRETCQTCRFQLARSCYQTGDMKRGMEVLADYLDNDPRPKERLAFRMVAQGHFDAKEWEKVREFSLRILELDNLEEDDRFNANLLLGQALYHLEKWKEAVAPLEYAAKNTKDSYIRGLCQIMMVRALVEDAQWRILFGKLPPIYNTDTKYDINLNLTLMKAGRTLFEEEDFLNALFLYRWVLPREDMLAFSETKIGQLENKLVADSKRGITPDEVEKRKLRIEGIKASMKALRELPPYEDEVTFRIGQIYAEVKRYWEGYVLFDKLYRADRESEIGEASALQSVLIFYDVNESDRAEERVIQYLKERPGGQFARTMLSMVIRDNLMKQNFARVVEMRPYLDAIPATEDEDELSLQADIHYMLAFGYFQTADHKSAGEQFAIIIENYPEATPASDSLYYRGMSFMMRADYTTALADFKLYQEKNEFGEHLAAALFREAVCEYGLENIGEAESAFTKFIEAYGDDGLVSEAYSMRGDIEASKESTNDDPHPLDRAIADYRKGIDKAVEPKQASYAAFQAAKVYKLEFKWQGIIDLMDYYMDRWEEKANVAESMFWIGQAKIELGQVDEAINAYVDAIERFGNDPEQLGVDKIILELVTIANGHLSEEDRDGLTVRLKLKLTNVDERAKVLRLRLQAAQALLRGDEAAAAFGAELLEKNTSLQVASSVSLALMCDAAVDTGNTNEMSRLSDFFITTYDESSLLWHAYRARTVKFLAEENYKDVLWTIEEAQGMFGAEPDMGWAQVMKADTEFKMGRFDEAYNSYNTIPGVPEWRGPLFAEAMYGMGKCKLATGELEAAHALFQRVYLLYKSYSDGDWAAKGYLAAADVLLKMGEEEKAVSTLKAMLEDEYTNTNPLAEQVRGQLKTQGVE